MAEQMQEIKRRIKSIGSTERITNAMQLVSAAKLRKSRKKFENAKSYLYSLIETIGDLFETTEDVPTEFLSGSREIKTKCCIVVTSSNGFCGSFNSSVIRAAEDYLEAFRDSEHKVKLITVGSKGKDYFSHHNYNIFMEHDAPADTVTFEETASIAIPVIDLYRKGEIDEVDVVFTSYVNPLKQEVVVKKLLPFDRSIAKASGNINSTIEYGPSAEEVFNYLIPKYVELVIYSTCIESAACENAARRMAMENAHNNASEMLDELNVQYNRARQTEITNEIIEIVAGSQAQK